MQKIQFCMIIILLISSALSINAETWPSFISDIYDSYSAKDYLIGIGEVTKTGNRVKDNRAADILSRLEIAEQVRIKIEAETVDQICEDKERLFKDISECRNAFKMVVKITVDEFIEGATIVAHGEDKGIVYAIAVLKRHDITAQIDRMGSVPDNDKLE